MGSHLGHVPFKTAIAAVDTEYKALWPGMMVCDAGRRKAKSWLAHDQLQGQRIAQGSGWFP